jgi:hypothetical protein
VVAVVKRLNVLATCREIWKIGKHKYLIRPASGHTSHSHLNEVLMRPHVVQEWSWPDDEQWRGALVNE